MSQTESTKHSTRVNCTIASVLAKVYFLPVASEEGYAHACFLHWLIVGNLNWFIALNRVSRWFKVDIQPPVFQDSFGVIADTPVRLLCCVDSAWIFPYDKITSANELC